MAGRPATPPPAAVKGGKPPGFDLLRHNLGVAGALEDFLAPTFGPGGRAKLFTDAKGTPIPTTDGAKMLTALDSPHPVARLLTAAAASQQAEWRDGTKVAALLALRLLRRAEPLLDAATRVPRIIRGYEIGLQLALDASTANAVRVDPMDDRVLLDVARASLGSWIEGEPANEVARAVVACTRQVAVRAGDGWRCNVRDVHVFAKPAGGFSVEPIHGYVLERSREEYTMPDRIVDAHIALLDAAPIRGKAGVHEPRLRWVGESKVLLKRPSELEKYYAFNDEYTAKIVESLRSAGANVVLCRLGISDLGQKLLAKAGILGIRRIMKTKYMVAVARATGARLIKDFHEVRPEQLGRAGLVEERRLGGTRFTVITQCPNPKVTSLLIGAPGGAIGEHYQAQAAKAIGAVAATIENPRLVVGGGGAEIAAARTVREGAYHTEGREQLAVLALADALEDIARCLATNLGLNPVDSLLELRRRLSDSPDWGLVAGQREPKRAGAGALLEPLDPRIAAWRRAVETCRQILRVDDFHKVGRSKRVSEGKADDARERANTES